MRSLKESPTPQACKYPGLFILVQQTYRQATLTTGCTKLISHEYYYGTAQVLLAQKGNIQTELKFTGTVSLCNAPAGCESLHSQLVFLSTSYLLHLKGISKISVQPNGFSGAVTACLVFSKLLEFLFPIIIVHWL